MKKGPPQDVGGNPRNPISNQSSLLLIPYNLYTYYTYVLNGYRHASKRPSRPAKDGARPDLKGSALPADPQIWKYIKNVKMYFVKNMLFLKVSGQMVSIAVFGVFFYIG